MMSKTWTMSVYISSLTLQIYTGLLYTYSNLNDTDECYIVETRVWNDNPGTFYNYLYVMHNLNWSENEMTHNVV